MNIKKWIKDQTYLPIRFILIWLLICLIYFKWHPSGFIWPIILTAVIGFIYRRTHHSGNFPDGKRLIYAPCGGAITFIKRNVQHPIWGQNLTQITIYKNLFLELGIKIPLTCSIAQIYTHRGFLVSLQSLTNECEMIGMEVRDPFRKFNSFISYGDIAYTGALLGAFSLVGEVDLYFPNHYEILVQVGDTITTSQIPIAGIVS